MYIHFKYIQDSKLKVIETDNTIVDSTIFLGALGNMTVVQTGLNSVEASWYPGVNGRIYYQQIGTNTIHNETISWTDTTTQLHGLTGGETYSIYIEETNWLNIVKAAAIIYIGIILIFLKTPEVFYPFILSRVNGHSDQFLSIFPCPDWRDCHSHMLCHSTS